MKEKNNEYELVEEALEAILASPINYEELKKRQTEILNNLKKAEQEWEKLKPSYKDRFKQFTI